MNNQLSNVSTQFRKFLKGQYISDPEQFNEFLDFFEDQDRLSRVMLQGVGIVCGFVPERVYPKTIGIAQDNFLQPHLLLNQSNQLSIKSNQLSIKSSLQPLERDIEFLQRDVKPILSTKAQLVKNVSLFPQSLVKLSKTDLLLAKRNVEFVKKNIVFTEGGISLSQGVAITTDGDLLTLNKPGKATKDLNMSDLKDITISSKLYTRYKAYDNYNAQYPAFDNNGQQVVLWELATTDEADKDFMPLDKLGDINNMYLLLYLESYEKEIKPCRGVDCDNYGIQQIRNLKVLLTTEEGIKQIAQNDKIYRQTEITGLVLDKKMERVILNDEIKSVAKLNEVYRSVIMDNISVSNPNPMFENMETIADLIGVPVKDTASFIEDILSYSDDTANIQYCYDVIKDLIDTYSETLELLPKSFTTCLPDLMSFPKHIMLGPVTSITKLKQNRHDFYNSPVLDNEKTAEKLELLIRRFYRQISQFKIPEPASVDDIRITPSRSFAKLGDEAIAFYYTMDEDLLKTWNFRKTSDRTYKKNLSYSNPFLSENPFDYTLGTKTFFRIEGLHGLDCDAAVKKISEIRQAAGISFDIIKLSFEELNNNRDTGRANFNEYLQRNPGIEHKAGVEAKGTFCVVYESKENPVIVADFSLPYICCAPKSDVNLSLPASSICEGAKRLPFTVSPLNGVVEADVAQNLNGGVVFSNGQYYFDPSRVSDSLKNKDINFTVNGKTTTCSISVITVSDINVQVSSIALPQSDKDVTTVTFKVVGAGFADNNYSWDFFGTGKYVSLNPDSNGIVICKYSELQEDSVPVINIQVSGKGCVQYITLRDWYQPPTSILTIDGITFPNGSCCDGYGYGYASEAYAIYGSL